MLEKRATLLLALLTVGIVLSCSSSRTKPASSDSQTKPALGSTVQQPTRNPHGDGVVPPEVVRAEAVRIEDGVKTLTVGNDRGIYLLSCNTNQENCITPAPGRNYLLFAKTTRWKVAPGAEEFMTLAWIQEWTCTYRHEENIALIPEDLQGGYRAFGMYRLRSWNKNRQE
jgi:hypothetical protein